MSNILTNVVLTAKEELDKSINKASQTVKDFTKEAVNEFIKDGTISNMVIENGGVTTKKIADNAVTTQKIVYGAVTTEKLNNNAVTTEKIANGSVTKEKLNSIVVGEIDSTKEEVTQARTATTGEKFNSVDDRIDAEVRRINESIKVSMLEQSEATTHSIKNSVGGRTTDMSVKGRTLQNLIPLGQGVVSTTKKIFGIRPMLKSDLFKPSTVYTVKFYNLIDSNGTSYVDFAEPTTFNIDKNTGVGKFTTKAELPPKGTLHFYTNGEHELAEVENVRAIILEGDWTQKEFPPYFEGIKSAGEEESKVEILSCGKNLFDISYFDKNKTLFNDAVYKCEYILKPNTKYACSSNAPFDEVSANIYFNGISSSSNGVGSNTPKVASTDKDGKIYILIRFNAQTEDEKVYNKILKGEVWVQLEEASSATSYEPYIEDEKVINLTIENGLKGIGDVKDEIVQREDGVYLIQRVSKVVLNGSENWINQTDFENQNTTLGVSFKISDGSSTPGKLCALSDRFPSKSQTNLHTEDSEGVTQGYRTIYIRVNKDKLIDTQDFNGFKKWLVKNPTTVYYPLETPKEIKLLDISDVNLNTYKEITHITSNNKIKPTLTFKAPIDTNKAMARLIVENRQLKAETTSLQERNVELQKTVDNQDEIINTTLIATDEMYTMIEPLLNDTNKKM